MIEIIKTAYAIDPKTGVSIATKPMSVKKK
jgi:hypothetical protein